MLRTLKIATELSAVLEYKVPGVIMNHGYLQYGFLNKTYLCLFQILRVSADTGINLVPSFLPQDAVGCLC